MFSSVISREELSECQQETGNDEIDQSVKVLSLLSSTRKETVESAKLYASNQANTLEAYLDDYNRKAITMNSNGEITLYLS